MNSAYCVTISNITQVINNEIVAPLFAEDKEIINIQIIENKVFLYCESPENADNIISKYNHQPILSEDLHVSKFRSPEEKIVMRKWKILYRNIPNNIAYTELYEQFQEFGEIHHISFYQQKHLAHIQFFAKESAEKAIQNMNNNIYYVWPQFSDSIGNKFIEIRGLPANFTEEQLTKLVNGFGKVNFLSSMYYLPHNQLKTSVSFVSFESRGQRKSAIENLDSKKIERKLIKVTRLLKTSPFHLQYSGDLSEFYYFIPIKGKHYIEFIDPPSDLDESKLRGICGRFGHVYDVSVLSKCKIDKTLRNSHVAFTTKGPMEKAVKALCNEYDVRRMPKSSPYYQQLNDNEKEKEE